MNSEPIYSAIRRTLPWLGVFFLLYGAALVIFVPEKFVSRQLELALSKHLQWDSLQHRDGSWQFLGVRARAFPSARVDQLTIRPRWVRLLRGEIGADFGTQYAGINLTGQMGKGLNSVRLSLSGKSETIESLALSHWSGAGTLDSGPLVSTGDMVLSNQGKIEDGELRIQWSDIKFQGLEWESLTLKADWQDNHFLLEGLSQGDMAITLTGELSAQLFPKPSTRLDATVQILPDPELPLLSQMLGGDKLQLTLLGSLSKIKAQCMHKKSCPDWVKQI